MITSQIAVATAWSVVSSYMSKYNEAIDPQEKSNIRRAVVP